MHAQKLFLLWYVVARTIWEFVTKSTSHVVTCICCIWIMFVAHVPSRGHAPAKSKDVFRVCSAVCKWIAAIFFSRRTYTPETWNFRMKEDPHCSWSWPGAQNPNRMPWSGWLRLTIDQSQNKIDLNYLSLSLDSFKVKYKFKLLSLTKTFYYYVC